MEIKKQIKALFTIAVVAMAVMVTSANAEITYDGFTSWSGANGSTTFDASESDKLVVVLTGEHGFNQTAGGQVYGVTYDGQTLIKAVDVDPKKIDDGGHGDTANDIWYLDNPDLYHTSGLIVTSTTGGNYVFTAILLSGTAEGVGATAAAAGAASVDITTTAANSIVIVSLGTGGGGNTADMNIAPNDPLTKISALKVGSNWAAHVVARATIALPGTQTLSFNTSKIDVATVAAAFEEVIIDPNLPTIEIGDDWITWSGQAVELLPVVVDNDIEEQRSLTHVWTSDPNSDPNTEVLFTEDGINPDDTATPEAVVTVIKPADTDNATVFELTLTVTLDGELPVVETIKIDVYDDACDAAVAIGSKAIIEATDFNKDCVTDMTDLAEMAMAWLLDYSMTAPTEMP